MIKKPIKLVLFAASSIMIPTLNRLLQSQQLAGVVLTDRVDNDTLQLQQQLEQGKIPHIRYQPDKPELVVHQVESWRANTGLIFTFSHKLPVAVINAFELGLFNLHASDLPRYRGAMPLYWQIRNREQQGYISLIKVTEAFDRGDILYQQTYPLHPLDTLNSLGNKMAQHAPECVAHFLEKFENKTLEPRLQTGEASLAAMPTQQDLLINWQTMAGEEIAAMARAGNPLFNGAMLIWQQAFVGLLQASVVEHATYGVPPGTVVHIGEPEGVIVATKDGALRLDILTITEGVFTGGNFAERFGLDAGIAFDNPKVAQ
ncbi:methionyl-tRNA formyltransferase [Thalassomonas haliotis]|uniref:Methionyl-tRNA formyltransferase n=1 Tax=Thalassomonas haliotis TaxID=485448 RepID=A0ABY7VCB2_9GAMM|nr:formyltransferase family protein [Thalassomonas haliotis]WDE11297.1 methionyl-tRNA formyltransferase [Thalassomonas haliotis]